MLASLPVSECGLCLLQACVLVLLGDQFSLRRIWVWSAVAQGQLLSAEGNQKDPVPACSLIPVLIALGRSFLGQEFEQKWWSYLWLQVCWYSWETTSFLDVFGYGELWHMVSSWRRQKPEGTCPRLLLSSCVLRSLGGSFGTEVVVLPVLTDMSALLGDQLSPSSIWLWALWHWISSWCRLAFVFLMIQYWYL